MLGALNDLKNRAIKLKNLIPSPEVPELTHVTQKTKSSIQNLINKLEAMLSEPTLGEEYFVRDYFRLFQRIFQQLEEIESLYIPALFHQNEDVNRLNKILFKINTEIKSPLENPIVACYSTSYYHTDLNSNIIYAPLAEPFFLLHIPDLFHEICHLVIENFHKESDLEIFQKYYDQILNFIEDYYKKRIINGIRKDTIRDLIDLEVKLLNQWKHYWIDEIICDLFALYTVGPAYAWSNLHLTAKRTKEPYRMDLHAISSQTHPADEPRMRVQLMALDLLGFSKISKEIKSEWNLLPIVQNQVPIEEFKLAYPNEILEILSIQVFEALKNSKFRLITKKQVNTFEKNSIVSLLNAAWNKFWEDPEFYNEWEKDILSNSEFLWKLLR